MMNRCCYTCGTPDPPAQYNYGHFDAWFCDSDCRLAFHPMMAAPLFGDQEDGALLTTMDTMMNMDRPHISRKVKRRIKHARRAVRRAARKATRQAKRAAAGSADNNNQDAYDNSSDAVTYSSSG